MKNKKLIKAAKDFESYDYGFNIDLLVESLKLTSHRLKTSDITVEGKKMGKQIDKFLEKLKIAKDIENWAIHEKLTKKAWKYFAKKYQGWWE